MKIATFCLACLLLASACKKYLAKSPDDSQAPPTTIGGYQELLDNVRMTVRCTPGIGPVAADDIVLDPTNTASSYWGIYTWQPSLYQGATDNSWSGPYQAIYYSNVTLQGMPNLPASEIAKTAMFNSVYGSAFFYRALHFFYLEETFGQPYRPGTTTSVLGIPLRLDADAQKKVVRSTVAAVYDRIVTDLLNAAARLQETIQSDHINRPCRSAAFALLARVWLVRQDYVTAQRYADSCLLSYNRLMNYDTVSTTSPHPFNATGNPEVLFQCSGVDYPPLYAPSTRVDSALYASYDKNDLRRALFFQPASSGGGVFFKGFYSSGHLTFSGCAVDEIFLIRAECRARNGDISGALDDLNHLLITRWKPGTFQPYVAATADQALRLIIAERRKELPWRELRWSDLRRLDTDGRFAHTLIRASGDSLPSGNARYTWLIPLSEISMSGIQQNSSH